MKNWKFKGMYLKRGWISPAYVSTDDNGKILSIDSHSSLAVDESVEGYAIAPIPNAHSHAFQYVMAGLTENIPKGHQGDNFWSWRERMYAVADQVNPEQMEVIASMLYAEMLRLGYDQVVEFHYLNKDSNGQSYNNPNEMAERLISAAKRVGMKITMTPVYYRTAGFNQGPSEAQRRFQYESTDSYFSQIEDLISKYQDDSEVKIGYGQHSLRAAGVEETKEIFAYSSQMPCHIHISEQAQEVEGSLKHLGARPVEWLANEVGMGKNTNLIHSTHITDNEMQSIIRAKANVVICPSTEGNLGDGYFPISDFVEAGGRWCIGSDSHIGINPFEDLRLLDYGQRMSKQKRNVLLNDKPGDSAAISYDTIFDNGHLASGESKSDYFHVGDELDALIINSHSPLMTRDANDGRLSTIVYALDNSAIYGRIKSGEWLVRGGLHINHDEIIKDFSQTVNDIN
jgi:formimidoylglutamate deiminase